MSTPNPAPAHPICPELGIEVPVGQIDQALHQLWEQDQARTNASLINLVVFSESPGSLTRNSSIIRDLTREHACRAILVEIDRSIPEPDLRAWITAHCHLADGRKSVCCEQIAFFLTGHVTGRFRNTVFAHLNSDLPLVFWWQGELSDVLTERLVAGIDRLIVDSSGWVHPAESFRSILACAVNHPSIILQDHAWTRTWQFRVGVAAIFDDPAGKLALPLIDHLEISHHPKHRNSALQLAAWMAVQAGWLPNPANPTSYLSASGRAIRLDFKSAPNLEPVGQLILRAGDFAASIVHAPGSRWVERTIDAPGYHVASPAPADPQSPGGLVALQLARGGSNALFQKILPEFLRLLDATA
jgi:glucose-6-phosphate dehydrogenase assembly protein OpcA